MTAEIGVMNKNGVALAADSAVTIGHEANKIYTSADKLFQLSPKAPVGIMIYGGADFSGLPWETIIKHYRDVASHRTFLTLEEYGTQFLSFLQKSRALFPRERQDSSVHNSVSVFLYFVRESIRKRLDKEAEEKDGLKDSDLPGLIADEIRLHLSAARKHELLPGIDKRTRDGLLQRYRKIIKDVRTGLFQQLPLTPAASRNLSTVVKEMLVRNWFGPYKSGVVVAGFGEVEFMPSLINYELDGMVSGKPRYNILANRAINDEISAYVMPFAQRDMVKSPFPHFSKSISTNLFRR